jgi:TPR repeat protein
VDVRWPAITPNVRRRVNTVAMSASQLLAVKADRERSEKEAAARRQQMAEAAAYSARAVAAEVETKAKIARGPMVAAATKPLEQATGQLARLFPQRRAEIALKPAPKDEGQLSRFGKVAEVAREVVAAGLPAAQRSMGGSVGHSFAAGAATMAMLAVAAIGLAPHLISRAPAVPSVATVQVQENVPVAGLEAVFKDLTAAGTTSPRRKSSMNVDIPTALSLADHSLRGQRTAGETEEAEFWLKRALGASLGGQDVGWALTQLGTLYAQSDSPRHSYAKAHVLWQLAAAQGDAVAHCFLGALYEHGLGVPASRALARQHFAVAETGSACRSAKDAATRLKD